MVTVIAQRTVLAYRHALGIVRSAEQKAFRIVPATEKVRRIACLADGRAGRRDMVHASRQIGADRPTVTRIEGGRQLHALLLLDCGL